jgi:exodeoxyribonuclease V alpha subunit
MPDEMTYDLEIENIHSFVCNGFVCHNSQGSEYPAVVLALHNSHWHMLRRNLFYTGLTRAKKHCIIAGTSQAIERAVDNNAQEVRNTTLQSLMK